MNIPKIAVITGPTATGKTALSLLLAKELNGEIVSADSMQLYRGMNIGTAKVTQSEMCGVPHHMVDVAKPSESYSVARYVAEADKCVCDILDRGKLPIIVGGTGLYIDSLVSGRFFAGGEPSHEKRDELNALYDTLGGEAMLSELSEIDPLRAEKLHTSDKKRIVRALEVFHTTGKTISEHDEETKKISPRYDAAIIALTYEKRETLYERIDLRVDKMLEAGLVDEVKGLINSGLSRESTAMQAIGYKELAAFLSGETTLEDAVGMIKRESRRYAKRQLTWLRRNEAVHWIYRDSDSDFAKARHDSAELLHERGIK